MTDPKTRREDDRVERPDYPEPDAAPIAIEEPAEPGDSDGIPGKFSVALLLASLLSFSRTSVPSDFDVAAQAGNPQFVTRSRCGPLSESCRLGERVYPSIPALLLFLAGTSTMPL